MAKTFYGLKATYKVPNLLCKTLRFGSQVAKFKSKDLESYDLFFLSECS